MHRVYVAWDGDEARRFLRVLEGHGIRGRVIEDREFPSRGELHDTEGAPEVWIGDQASVARALELASVFETERDRKRAGASDEEPEPEPDKPTDDVQPA